MPHSSRRNTCFVDRIATYGRDANLLDFYSPCPKTPVIYLEYRKNSFQLSYVTCNSCNMGTRDLPDMYARGPQARGLRAYISGKSRVHMLQVICNTSGTLKICPNLMSIFPPLYIVTGTRCDCGTLFHRCHDVLAW